MNKVPIGSIRSTFEVKKGKIVTDEELILNPTNKIDTNRTIKNLTYEDENRNVGE